MSMKISVKQLRTLIRETVIAEMRGPSGKLRDPGGKSKSSGRQVKLGKIEDENGELSSAEADLKFPGSVDAWCEVVPDLFPDFPWTDPIAIRRGSEFYKIGNQLRAGFKSLPGVELAFWEGAGEDGDWFALDEA